MASTTSPLVRRMSLMEFLAIDENETGPKCELEYGELIELMRPTFEHNELVLSLSSTYNTTYSRKQPGSFSQDIIVVLDEDLDLAYAPDLVFVATEHLHRIREGRVYGAPDLVVEVLSPSTASREPHQTRRLLISWYWIVDTTGPGIEEYSATDGGYLRTATVESKDIFQPGIFPGLNIELATLIS